MISALDPFGSSERHIYLTREEFEKFNRGVPIERETDGLELTIFPSREEVNEAIDEGDQAVREALEEGSS